MVPGPLDDEAPLRQPPYLPVEGGLVGRAADQAQRHVEGLGTLAGDVRRGGTVPFFGKGGGEIAFISA